MELVLPYLEPEGFRNALLQDYRFKQKDYLNSSILEMPTHLGDGKLILFNKKHFHFFRGKWDFGERTIFHSPHKVGENGLMDFRISKEGRISSNFISSVKEFEHDTTNIDGIRIFVPKSILPNDIGRLKVKLENADRNYLSREKLFAIFNVEFGNFENSILLESRILEFLSYWVHYLRCDEKAFESKKLFDDKIILAKEFVDENSLKSIEIKQIGRYCGLNNCDLKKGFKDLTGLPIRQYIIKQRMETAKSMLLETDDSVGQISDFIGYHNRGHFSQLYFRFFGKLPSDERV